MDLRIESITSQAEWAFEGKEGPYRFILYQCGFEHGVGEMWVQWLQWDTDKDELYTHKVIVAKIPITAINTLRFAPEQLEGLFFGPVNTGKTIGLIVAPHWEGPGRLKALPTKNYFLV